MPHEPGHWYDDSAFEGFSYGASGTTGEIFEYGVPWNWTREGLVPAGAPNDFTLDLGNDWPGPQPQDPPGFTHIGYRSHYNPVDPVTPVPTVQPRSPFSGWRPSPTPIPSSEVEYPSMPVTPDPAGGSKKTPSATPGEILGGNIHIGEWR